MPTRPDLRDLTTNVREAFAAADRDTLLDVLAFVVREYVVDGPPPMLVHQTERIEELAGLSFAALVSALQTRLEHPELAMFAVDGEQVSIRIGGVMQPIQAIRTPPPPVPGAVPSTIAPAAAWAPPAADLPRPAAGVRVVEATLGPRPAPPAAAPAAPPAPAASPATPPAVDKAPASSGTGDDASARFSLLELD